PHSNRKLHDFPAYSRLRAVLRLFQSGLRATRPPGAVAGYAENFDGQVGVGLVGDGSVSAPSPS
ncbi:hypothetical protein NQZ68_016825, partial [Dissostichus eleginoides]